MSEAKLRNKYYGKVLLMLARWLNISLALHSSSYPEQPRDNEPDSFSSLEFSVFVSIQHAWLMSSLFSARFAKLSIMIKSNAQQSFGLLTNQPRSWSIDCNFRFIRSTSRGMVKGNLLLLALCVALIALAHGQTTSNKKDKAKAAAAPVKEEPAEPLSKLIYRV